MNKIFVVVGPSGAGKSSFIDKVVIELPFLRDIITCTTRAMRKGETEGHPYHFLSHAEFKKRMAQDYFVEWAQVHDQLYGTPKDQIKQAWRDGHAVIMDIDVQGAKTFMSKYPQETITIFILPPSIDALRQRVIKREGRKPEDLELRMTRAKEEMAQANEFDFQLVNDDFVQAFSEFKKIIEKAVG